MSGGQASEALSAAPYRSPSLALSPEPSPSQQPSVEELSSTKPVPGAKKVGDRWFNQLVLVILNFFLIN